MPNKDGTGPVGIGQRRCTPGSKQGHRGGCNRTNQPSGGGGWIRAWSPKLVQLWT
jgi:hypothetical protein